MINAELTESIGGEEHLFFGTIGHNDLRPMDHRRSNKLQRQSAKVNTLPFRYDLYIRCINSKLLHERYRLL